MIGFGTGASLGFFFAGECAQRLLGSSDAGPCRARLEEIRKLLSDKEQLKKEISEKRKLVQKTIKQLEADIYDIETNKDKIVRL